MLDYISIRYRIEIFSFCNSCQIFARSVVKIYLWVCGQQHILFSECAIQTRKLDACHIPFILGSPVDRRSLWTSWALYSTCLTAFLHCMCRPITCICCYTLPLQSLKFNNIYFFWHKKHKHVLLSHLLHELNKCCLHVIMLSKCRLGPDKIHQLLSGKTLTNLCFL